MTLYEYKKGLRIQLNKDDIEEFTHLNWIELNGSDHAETIVCIIAKECDTYKRRHDEK